VAALARWHQVAWLDPATAAVALRHLEEHRRTRLAAHRPGPVGEGGGDTNRGCPAMPARRSKTVSESE
jgi:hypothetical protein